MRWKLNLGVKFRSDFGYSEPTWEGGLISRRWDVNGLIQCTFMHGSFWNAFW